MKVNILLLLPIAIILLGLGCGSFAGNDSTANDKLFEGWAGPPEDMEKKPFEYYYMRRINRASPKSVEKQDPVRMRETCTDGAALTAKADFMRKFISTLSSETENGPEDTGTGCSICKKIHSEIIKEIKVKTKDCRPLKKPQSEIPGIEWEECECTMYSKVAGGEERILARERELKNETNPPKRK